MLRVKHMLSDYNNEVKIAIMDKRDNSTSVAKPLEFIDVTNKAIEEPTLQLNFHSYDKQELATFFLDWIAIAEDLNIKLNQDFSKEKQAILNHLADMRKLVFKEKNNV